MISNYIDKRGLEDHTLKLYEKVEFNFIRAKKLQPAIDEVKDEIREVQRSLDAFKEKMKQAESKITEVNVFASTRASQDSLDSLKDDLRSFCNFTDLEQAY